MDIDIDLDNGGLDERHEKNKGGASVAQGEEAGGRRRDMTGRQESPAWSHPVNPKLVCANMNLLVSQQPPNSLPTASQPVLTYRECADAAAPAPLHGQIRRSRVRLLATLWRVCV